LRHLRRIGISGNQLTDEGAAVLRDQSGLDRIYLGSPTTGDAVRRLGSLSEKSISLEIHAWAGWDEGITDEGHAAIARIRGMRELNLRGIKGAPSDEALLQLAELRDLRKLTLAF